MANSTTTPYVPDARGLVQACPHCGRRNRLIYERLGSAFRCGECHRDLAAPAEPVEILGVAEFDALVSKSAFPVLVDFWAPWCGPCLMVAPELVKVAAAGAGRWIVAKVNTEELPQMGQRFGIRGIPTMVVFKGGKEVLRQSGAMGAPEIVQFIQRAL